VTRTKGYKNIFLIGFMGAGKSSVGKKLAKRLHMGFSDLDEAIEKGLGVTVSEVFSRWGEGFFRDTESRILRSLAQKSGQVIATGGGIVLRECNWETMKKWGITVYLRAPIEVLWSRIEGDASRPLLRVEDPLKRAQELFSERVSLYEKADLIVDTENASPDDVAEDIIEKLITLHPSGCQGKKGNTDVKDTCYKGGKRYD
jgi:shikimate kinase